MKNQQTNRIDALIEDALSSESLRPTPAGLHRRFEERFRIALLREQERQRFRYSMVGLSVSFLIVFGAAALLVSFTNLGVFLSHGVAGARGQMDGYLAAWRTLIGDYSGAYSLLLSIALTGGALLLALAPMRGRVRNH